MTYHQPNRRGYGHVTVLKFCRLSWCSASHGFVSDSWATCSDITKYSSKIADLNLPNLYLSPSWLQVTTFESCRDLYDQKTRVTRYHKLWRCLHHRTSSRFDTIPACDGQTEGRTDGRTDRRTHDEKNRVLHRVNSELQSTRTQAFSIQFVQYTGLMVASDEHSAVRLVSPARVIIKSIPVDRHARLVVDASRLTLLQTSDAH